MINLHGQATRGAFSMGTTNNFLIIRIHRMLKSLNSRNQNQRDKGIKVKLGLRKWLALAVCFWMIYQLRVFLNHKLSSENGVSVKEENESGRLKKLGRKAALAMNIEIKKPDEEEDTAEAIEDDKGKQKQENQQELEDKEDVEQQSKDLVDGMDRGGDADDEEPDTVRFDDPMDEIDALNYDDEEEEDDGVDDKDDSPLGR